jgi:hypothetical protein
VKVLQSVHSTVRILSNFTKTVASSTYPF